MAKIKAPWVRKQRRTLSAMVCNTLKDAIKAGKLRPNEKLVEGQLTHDLGVSRTPIREALHRLEVEGYVKPLPSGGYAVVDLTLQRVRDLCEVRQALEGYTAFLACSRMNGKQLKALESIQEKLNQACQAGDLDALSKLNNEFHAQLSRASGNEQLIARVEALRSYFYTHDVLRHLSLDAWRESIPDHQLIIDAIKEHKCESISQIMHYHIQRSTDFYSTYLR